MRIPESWPENIRESGRISDYFSVDEFRCKGGEKCGCGGALPEHWTDTHDRFFWLLDFLRESHGGPVKIISGFRCRNHPLEVVKERPGAHQTGLAADLSLVGINSMKAIYAAIAWRDMTGYDTPLAIGVKSTPKSMKFHVDLAGDHIRRGRDVFYTYS